MSGKHWVIAALPWLVLACAPESRSAEWYKGNTHAHTRESGGDSSPAEVAKWYRRNGYNFVFITDHERVTNVDPLNASVGAAGRFLVIQGEEVSSNFTESRGKVFVHVNSLHPRETAKPAHGASARETLQANLDAIRSAGGLAQINHPNFMWQLNADDIAAVTGARLLEIMNMHPLVNSFGAGPAYPGAEELWDQVLSKGRTIWGVASDDMHDLKPHEGNEQEGAPGKGWIMVRAEHLTAGEIMDAIDRGDFYASTGVVLKDYRVVGTRITIEMPDSNPYMIRYRTRFIGVDGVVLQDGTDTPAVYVIKGTEGYVRARVCDSNGKTAWTQPFFVSGVARQAPSPAAPSAAPAGSIEAHSNWPAPKNRSDVDTVEHLVAALYEVISGPAGQPRDWDRFRSLFLPDGRLGVIRAGTPAADNQPARLGDALFRTPDMYVERNDLYLKTHGFFERGIANRVEEFGNLIHVWSTYESRHAPTDAVPFARGINSIQIVHAQDRFWLADIVWDDERPGLTLPEKYLSSSGP